MRSVPGSLAIAVLALGVGLAAQNPLRLGSQFRTGIEVIGITATVVDSEGGLVTGLTAEDFVVFEDGEPQPITQFTAERVPVSLAVLLDVSDSMYGQRIVDARTAVTRFLFELLDPTDEYMVLSFNHRPHPLTNWTRDQLAIRSALEEIVPFGGTAIYDAVMTSLSFFKTRAEQRAAILLISDGADSASDAEFGDLRSAMLRTDAFAYAIAIDPPDGRPINGQVNPTTLRGITDTSGGRTEVVQDNEGLLEATASIADELNHQYMLGYNSPHAADGEYHSIRLRVPVGEYRVRARTGYVAGDGR